VGSAAFSRDGKWILTVGEKLAQVWDANTLKTVKALPKSEEDLKFGLFSPDDSMIAVGSWSGTVEVWSTATWKSLVKLVGHEAMVFHAAFSPDSRWLITAAVDGTARLWNPKTGVCFATLHGANAVYGVSFSPDGRSFAVGEWDGTTRVYACDICGTLGDLCALADKRIGRPLTAEERVKYLH
jgi:WD40 repeat protein